MFTNKDNGGILYFIDVDRVNHTFSTYEVATNIFGSDVIDTNDSIYMEN